MPSIADKLSLLEFDEDCKVSGTIVTRTSDGFAIGGETYSLEEAVETLENKSESSGFNYKRTGFVFMTPAIGEKLPRVVSACMVKDRAAHLKLLAKARSKNLHLFFGNAIECEGKMIQRGPLALDWDCLGVEEELPNKSSTPTGLHCPYCGKQVSSTPGRTLHVKNKHPEKLDVYMSSLGR